MSHKSTVGLKSHHFMQLAIDAARKSNGDASNHNFRNSLGKYCQESRFVRRVAVETLV